MACLLAALLKNKINVISNKYTILDTEIINSKAKMEPCMKYVWMSQDTEWIDSLPRLGDANFLL